jgi:hypothetical protein
MVTAFHTAVHRVKKAAAILIRELIEGEVLFCFVLFCSIWERKLRKRYVFFAKSSRLKDLAVRILFSFSPKVIVPSLNSEISKKIKLLSFLMSLFY